MTYLNYDLVNYTKNDKKQNHPSELTFSLSLMNFFNIEDMEEVIFFFPLTSKEGCTLSEPVLS